MVGGSIKSYLLKRVSTVRIRPGAPGNMTASRERRRFWSVGAAGGFGPSTPASPISPRGEFSNPPGGTREYDGVARAASFLVCGGRRPIRAVDTRVTNFPAGGVSNPPGGARDMPSPVPQRCRALLVLNANGLTVLYFVQIMMPPRDGTLRINFTFISHQTIAPVN